MKPYIKPIVISLFITYFVLNFFKINELFKISYSIVLLVILLVYFYFDLKTNLIKDKTIIRGRLILSLMAFLVLVANYILLTI
jgi:hypothetical protein